MKKIILIGLALIVSGCQMNNSGSGHQVDGGFTNQNNPLVDPDYYYEIDTWGSNADIFEFTPRSNPNYSCVSVGVTSRGVFCFPKAVKGVN